MKKVIAPRGYKPNLAVAFVWLVIAWLPRMSGAAEHKGSPQPLLFMAALKTMVDGDPSLREAKAKLAASEAQLRKVWSAFVPSLQLSATDKQSETSTRVQAAGASAEWNLFRSGADLATWQAQNDDVEVQRLNLQLATLQVESDVATLLFDWIAISARLELASNLVQLSNEFTQIETQRYQQGRIPKQETLKAQIEHSNAQAREQDLKAKLADVKIKITQRLFATTATAHDEIGIAKGWPWQSLLSSQGEGLLQKAFTLESSPKWLAASREVERQKNLAKTYLGNHLPSLDLSLGYGTSDLAQSTVPTWTSYLQLKIPLVDWGKVADYQTQAQQILIAQARLDKVKRDVLGDWQSLNEQMALALSSAKARSKSVEVARSLYADNQRRLRMGRSSFNEVVVDQNRLSDAEALAVEGWAKVHTLYTQLCHIRGKQIGCLNERGNNKID